MDIDSRIDGFWMFPKLYVKTLVLKEILRLA